MIWALAATVAGALWLLGRQRPNPTDPTERQSSRLTSILRVSALALCAFWAVCWLGIALIRLGYPFELEWNGGEMRDHCARLLAGQALYVAPGPGWFPYEYPPLYFWVSAGVSRLTGCDPYQGMRWVSILSTLGSAALVVVWVRRLVGDRRVGLLWGALSAGLFLAAYRMTGAWFDIERLDMLFLFLSLLGIVWLGEGLVASTLSALALTLAFFTKQQAVLFIVAGAAALTWRREWRQLLGFCAVALLACLLPALALNAATHGWFGYYCFKVPLANGIQPNLARLFLLSDLPLYAPMIAIVVLALITSLRNRAPSPIPRSLSQQAGHEDLIQEPQPGAISQETPQIGSLARGQQNGYRTGNAVLVAMTAAGLLGSLLSRAHWGGDQNVLLAGYLFLGIAACVAAGRWEAWAPAVGAPLYALVLAQLFALVYRPDAQLPARAALQAGQRYAAAIRALEREGEVLCLDHGGFTSPAHFQIMGLLDVLKTEKRVPPTLVAALRAHRYAAIVTDELPKPDTLFYGELLRDYAPAERLNLPTPWVVTGYLTPAPDRPVWVLRPRP